LSRRPRTDHGFTLIEMMIVLLTVAILVAIAIPLLSGVRDRFSNRATQGHVRNGFVAERGYYAENGEYTDLEADLQDFDPAFEMFQFPELADRPFLMLSLDEGAGAACLTARSDSGSWWSMYVSQGDEPYYGDLLPIPCTAALTAVFSPDGW
jgi:prepilin-type N-terminal cleavage/methylation domain-containing protein